MLDVGHKGPTEALRCVPAAVGRAYLALVCTTARRTFVAVVLTLWLDVIAGGTFRMV